MAEQAAKDAEEQRKKMNILKANTWTVGAVLWTLFDEKGQSMLQRCCRVDPAASPDSEIRSKLAALTQEEVDGYIDKTFARSEYGPVRVTIRGLLQVLLLACPASAQKPLPALQASLHTHHPSIRHLYMQVDAARRGALDNARKKGAFVADATLAL